MLHVFHFLLNNIGVSLLAFQTKILAKDNWEDGRCLEAKGTLLTSEMKFMLPVRIFLLDDFLNF